jgi:hypothetical protein
MKNKTVLLLSKLNLSNWTERAFKKLFQWLILVKVWTAIMLDAAEQFFNLFEVMDDRD